MRDEQIKAQELGLEFLNECKEQHYSNHFSEAIQLGQKAIELFKIAGDVENYSVALNLVGVTYGAAGNDDMAIDTYLEGLECAMENHLPTSTLLIYNNIGSKYQQLHEQEKAIAYFRKAEQFLSDPDCMKAERYSGWALVIYMNLSTSYCALGDYVLSRRYMEKARPYMDDEGNEIYRFSIMISECVLAWHEGKEEYVREQMDELMEGAMHDENATDYVQDTQEIAGLLKRMKEYDNWKKIIVNFEEYAKAQGSVYCEMLLLEMWMDYYKTIHDMEQYTKLCVEHVELYQKQRNQNDRERVAAIDMRIELREKEAVRKQVEQMANIDSLTKLGNRNKLEKDSTRMLQRAVKHKSSLGVGVLDLDSFKTKNDMFGHLKGDECLVSVAEVLQKVLKDCGEAYRFGGDEFIVLLPDANADMLGRIAEKIKQDLNGLQENGSDKNTVPELTLSQGYVSCCPNEDDTISTLISFADKALYDVKRAGKNNYHIYENENDRLWIRRQG